MKLLLLGVLLAAAGEQPGRALFDAAGCRSCHKVSESGGNTGPDLTLAGHRRDKAWLDRWLEHPRGWKPDTLMPEPRLTPAARAAIVAYLSESRPWTGAATAEKAFVKAGCAACHGPKGRGGDPVAPALMESAETFTRLELLAVIRDGKGTMPAWKKVLSDKEIEALADYVSSLAVKRDW